MKRKTTRLEKEVFLFLNDLRDSGETNMFGAAPYIQEEFEVDKSTSRKLLTIWMDNFNDSGEYDEINNNHEPINID